MYMTTENIVELPEYTDRPLGVLLDLGTYQGMTDSEIESVLQHKIRLAIMESVSEAQQLVTNEKLEMMKATTELRNLATLNVLQLHEVRPIVYASSYMEGNENG